MRVVLLTLALATAGCLGAASAPEPEADTVAPAATPTAAPGPALADAAAAPAAASEPRVVDVSFDGWFRPGAFVCWSVIQDCAGVVASPQKTGHRVEGFDGTAEAATVTLTWDTTTPTTERLALGVMTMWPSEDRDKRWWQEVAGTSPLTIDAAGLDAPVSPDVQFHVYVYVPFPVWDPWVDVHAEQTFNVTGAFVVTPASAT